MNPKVDFFFEKSDRWKNEFLQLRKLVLNCGLQEQLKWGCPCYTFENKNIVLIHGFKEYCALLLFKGALLPDPAGILIQQTKNVQAARQIRFTSEHDIFDKSDAIRDCILNAVEIEKSGIKVQLKQPEEFEMAAEFQQKLDENPELFSAFQKLTPGRRRAYFLHFSAPKQSKTRMERVEKCIPEILRGRGLNDKVLR